MSNDHPSPCEYARDRHQNLLMWRNLWSILLFAFGTAVVIFLVGAIFFFIRQSWLPGALGTLSTIASSVAIKWVADRRTLAVTEEESAYQDVEQKCNASQKAEVLKMRVGFRLFDRVL